MNLDDAGCPSAPPPLYKQVQVPSFRHYYYRHYYEYYRHHYDRTTGVLGTRTSTTANRISWDFICCLLPVCTSGSFGILKYRCLQISPSTNPDPELVAAGRPR